MKIYKIKEKGLTLVEIMIAVAILGMVVIFVFEPFISQHRSYLIQEEVTNIQQDIRGALQLLTEDIKMAGYGVVGTTPLIGVSDATGIGINRANSAFTYVVKDALGNTSNIVGVNTIINVRDASAFPAGSNVAILSYFDGSLVRLLNSNIIATDVAADPDTITTDDAAAQVVEFMEGDRVIPVFGASTYTWGGADTPLLRDGTPITDNLPGFQLSYLLENGAGVRTQVADAATTPIGWTFPDDIIAVRISITGQTTKEVSVDRTRTLATMIRIINNNRITAF